MKSDYLRVSTKVKEAVEQKLPVVAIDTAAIYLGLKNDPDFLEVMGGTVGKGGTKPDYALITEETEKIIVQNGAVPASMAVIDGVIHVGLNREKRRFLAENCDSLKRITRRDLPVALAMKWNGVLTISATMMVATMAEIQVVVGMGIGGVSEKHSENLDVSCDLIEMVQNNLVVVTSGVNPGVNPAKSMEYLETHGVPVIGFRDDKFCTGWQNEKYHGVQIKIDEPTDIAEVQAVKRSLDITSSMLVIKSLDEDVKPECFDAVAGGEKMIEVLKDNATLGAWIASAISMDLDPNIRSKNTKTFSRKKEEKSMSFEVWLFAVKGFAQNYDVAQLIYNNLPESEKERLRQEYEDTVK